MPTPPEPPPIASAPTRRARERDDLLLLAACTALVPLGWLLLGWRWPACVSGYDGWATALPLLQALGAAGGRWSALAYRPELLGGIALRDGVGPNPLAALLAGAGLSATAVYDLCAFALQALIGFFGARAAGDLAHTFAPASAPAASGGWPGRMATAVLCAFAPALGWRLGYGHLAMTTGLLPFAAALALLAAAGARRTSVTLCAAAALATADGLLFTGHQLVLYGIVFGAPILCGVWLAGRAPARTLALPAAALFAGLLLALPALSGVVRHALGGDGPRPPVGLHITYAYLTARPLDWLTSLPWTRLFVPAWRPLLHHHESNVPLGPLLALLVLVPWRRALPLAVGLGLSAAMVLAFSMDLRPFSSALVAVVPLLGSFRVPTRAALPLVIALAPVACAAAVAALPAPPRRAWILGAAGFLTLALIPPLPREILGWTLAAALAARRWRPAPAPVAAAALLALAGGALGAFGERLLPPFRDTEALLAEARALGRDVMAREPELGSPLVRVAFLDEIPELGANTAFAAGLSSIDGYFFPSRRFIELVTALRHQPYDASAFVLRFRPDEAAARVLFALYDVRFTAGDAARTARTVSVPSGVPGPGPREPWRLELQPLGPTAGTAWFAARVETVPDFSTLAARLHEAGPDLAARLHETAWLVADPATAGVIAPPPCGSARVLAVAADRAGRIALDVDSPAPCPLVVATNFAESLRARARVGESWQPARVFPAYGALLGLEVPAGASRIEVAPR